MFFDFTTSTQKTYINNVFISLDQKLSMNKIPIFIGVAIVIIALVSAYVLYQNNSAEPNLSVPQTEQKSKHYDIPVSENIGLKSEP